MIYFLVQLTRFVLEYRKVPLSETNFSFYQIISVAFMLQNVIIDFVCSFSGFPQNNFCFRRQEAYF